MLIEPASGYMPVMIAILRETISEFARHKSGWLAAAIAYFTMFAVAPLIIVVVEIAGVFLGRHQDALNELYRYLRSTAGPAGADGIKAIVAATLSQRRTGTLAQIVSWAIFTFAAVGLFGSLQEALNTVWDVAAVKRPLAQTIKNRLVSFAAVLAVALLLMLSLGLNAALTIAASALAQIFPAFPTLLNTGQLVVSFVLVAVLFAFLFEYLPERRIAWRDVWLGAAVSAGLFVLGQSVLGWYLGRAAISSGYGAFGGIVVFLLWAYYSAQIFLFGAELTHVISRRRAAGDGGFTGKRPGARASFNL